MYFDYVLQDHPAAAWDFGKAKDITGNSFAMENYQCKLSNPILTGQNSLIVSDRAYIFYESENILRSGHESQSFTLEFWTYLTNISGVAALLVKDDDSTCGIYATDSYIYFYLPTLSDGDVYLKYERATHAEKLHVVLQYTPASMSLFVNSVVVDSFTFTSAPVFSNDLIGLRLKSYLANDIVMFTREMAGVADTEDVFIYGIQDEIPDDSFMLSGVALYKRSLESYRIRRHFTEGFKSLETLAVSTSNDTKFYTFADDLVHDLKKFSFSGLDFASWTIDNLLLSNDGIRQTQSDDGTWEFGSMTKNIALDGIGVASASKIQYPDLHNIIVSMQLNGDPDYIESNETQLNSIPTNTDLTNRYLTITIEFLPITETVPAALDKFELTLYGDIDITGNDSTIPAQFTSMVMVGSKYFEPINANATAGSRILQQSANGVFPASVDFQYNAVELWLSGVKGQIGDLLTIEGAGNIPVMYINGEPRMLLGDDLSSQTPIHVLLVLEQPTSGQIVVGGETNNSYPHSLLYIAKHNELITPDYAYGLYASYVGGEKVTFKETSSVNVIESNDSITGTPFMLHTYSNPNIISM
jgi:hypothetical protein